MSISKGVTVLVTGATGAIGPRVVHALCVAGYLVRTFSLDTPETELFPPNVDKHIGDDTDQVAVQSAMQGVEVVVYMAALLHIVNPPPELREKYERINVGGTVTVVEAAIKAGVKRVVLFSTIAVYGPSDGCVLNEMSPTQPDTFYAQTKLSAEKIVLNARGVNGQPFDYHCPFGENNIKGAFLLLVGSGGGGQRDFSNAKIQDDAAGNTGSCHTSSHKPGKICDTWREVIAEA